MIQILWLLFKFTRSVTDYPRIYLGLVSELSRILFLRTCDEGIVELILD